MVRLLIRLVLAFSLFISPLAGASSCLCALQSPKPALHHCCHEQASEAKSVTQCHCDMTHTTAISADATRIPSEAVNRRAHGMLCWLHPILPEAPRAHPPIV